MKILYFAQLRQMLGKSEDILYLKKNIKIYEVIDELIKRNETYRVAFNDIRNLQYAINCEYANKDSFVSNKDELAVFPPVTGG
ncbi:MAG: MoaD/ThiS family protein [Alphaproteobacteria bacterium]